MTTTFETPTDAALKEKALTFLRLCKPKVYREAKRTGELSELVALKVEAAKTYAKNLMTSGEWVGNAWNRAIRLEILESETD